MSAMLSLLHFTRLNTPIFECPPQLCYGSDRSEIWTHASWVMSPFCGAEGSLYDVSTSSCCRQEFPDLECPPWLYYGSVHPELGCTSLGSCLCPSGRGGGMVGRTRAVGGPLWFGESSMVLLLLGRIDLRSRWVRFRFHDIALKQKLLAMSPATLDWA